MLPMILVQPHTRLSTSRPVRWRCQAKSGLTLRPMGRNPVCYNYRATLISCRSCLKPIDTFRSVEKDLEGACGPRPFLCPIHRSSRNAAATAVGRHGFRHGRAWVMLRFVVASFAAIVLERTAAVPAASSCLRRHARFVGLAIRPAHDPFASRWAGEPPLRLARRSCPPGSRVAGRRSDDYDKRCEIYA
jgi:hypothetical protein